MNPTTISFVRHGLVDNPQTVYYGRLPRFQLSGEGIRQAQIAGEVLAEASLAAVFTSPLLRARQTARIILANHAECPLRISRLLIEVYTPFDGNPHAVVAARNWDVYTGTPPEYEQPQDVLTRAQKFISRVRQQYAGQHVVAVTHGDLIFFTLLWSKGAPAAIRRKKNLHDCGFPDPYPATASISSFTFTTSAENEIPAVEYIHPYS